MIEIDKIAHFLAGFFIATVINVIPIYYMRPDLIWIGYFVAMFVGLCKELAWDLWIKKTVFDWADFIVTCIGGAVGLFIDFLKI